MPKQDSSDLNGLTKKLTAFRDVRDWRQFHSLKDLIISLNLEAGEVLELTQWQNDEAVETALSQGDGKTRLEEECADVLNYLILVAEHAGIDLIAAANRKIDQNKKKYPIAKSKGNAKKYDQL